MLESQPTPTARLLLLGRDAEPVKEFAVAGEATIGTAGATIPLPADSRLSQRHARVYFRDRALWLEDLNSKTGTFLRQRTMELADGDVFLAGRELFRFRGNEPRPRLERINWHGEKLATHRLERTPLTIGREEGDLTFPDDPILSSRHARVVAEGGKYRVDDLQSLNGIFLRLREPRRLADGNVVLVGQKLLRIRLPRA